MTLATRRRPILAVILVAVGMLVAACSSGSAGPSSSTPASPSAAPSTTPSAAPSASATPVPPASASAASACPVIPQTSSLPSDRLLDFTAAPGDTSDTLTFAFGDPSLPGPAAAPKGALEVARPPYTVAGSDRPVQMAGAHVVAIRFTGMSLQNDAGEPTYVGPRGIEEPDFPALRHAVVYDESEGVIAWYVGYDGPGCVTMARAGKTIIVTIDHT